MNRLLLVLLAVLLAGCGQVPTRSAATTPAIPAEAIWLERQQQLQQLTDWQLAGRLAVLKEHEAWHMTIEWQQHNERYSLNIIAPLGQGSMQLHGDAYQVTLITDEGEIINASSPDLLLYQQLGWHVPVSALRYWVLGLPAPGDYQKTLDEQGRLSTLHQAGWEIEFLDYEPQLGVELPRKVFVGNHSAKVKLVVNDRKRLTTALLESPH